MGQPQNSYARRARQQAAEGVRLRRESPDLLSVRPKPSVENARVALEKGRVRRQTAFDALQVGDSLESFGLCATVAKKNRKSVVTDMGVRWTKEGLC